MRAKKNPELDVARNSGIYFAIGLNIMLFLSWRLLEFKTYDKDDVIVDVMNVDHEIEEDIPIVNANTPPPPPPPAAIQESVTIVEDTKDIEETIIESTEVGQEDAIEEHVAVEDVQVEKIEEEVDVPFSVIEHVPIFPGCEGLNNAKAKECFQEKMMQHVARNFKYPEAALDLQIQGRVSVIFTIDSSGKAVKIKSRGPDKILEKEAERIISLLPRMKPGTQRGKPVNVAYALPVMFRIATQ